MRRRLFAGCASMVGASFLILLFTRYAGAALSVGDNFNEKLLHDSVTRYYDVYVPPSCAGKSAVPLLVELHGLGGNKTVERENRWWRAIADSEGIIVAYPLGRYGTGGPPPEGFNHVPGKPPQAWDVGGPSWNARICCGSAAEIGVDDVGFIRAMVSAISAGAKVDTTRIYATGVSNGGAMAHRLGCEAADRFAAVAPVAFPLNFYPVGTAVPNPACDPGRPLPIIMFLGLTDGIVPYAGGTLGPIEPNVTVESAATSFKYYRDINRCAGTKPDRTMRSGNSMCEAYVNCGAGAEVTLCSIRSNAPGNPVIPGTAGHFLYLNPDVNIARLAWDFLSRFSSPDTDSDGLADWVETNMGTFVSAAGTGTDPNKLDADGDVTADGVKVLKGTDANDP